MDLFDYRPRLTSAEQTKLYADHLRSLAGSGIEYDRMEILSCLNHALLTSKEG